MDGLHRAHTAKLGFDWPPQKVANGYKVDIRHMMHGQCPLEPMSQAMIGTFKRQSGQATWGFELEHKATP